MYFEPFLLLDVVVFIMEQCQWKEWGYLKKCAKIAVTLAESIIILVVTSFSQHYSSNKQIASKEGNKTLPTLKNNKSMNQMLQKLRLTKEILYAQNV